MKFLLAFLVLIPSLATADEITLEHKNIFIGTVQVAKFDKEIKVIRTASTPKSVLLSYNFVRDQKYCSKETVFDTDVGDINNCMSYGAYLYMDKSTVKFNFSKAAKLGEHEKEIYTVLVSRRSRSEGLYFEVLDSEADTEYSYLYKNPTFSIFGSANRTKWIKFIAN